LRKNVNWWNIINKIDHDNTTWDYLEPAEVIELVQRITEAKEKIKGLDKYVSIKLSPALHKLKLTVNPFNNKDENPYNYIEYKNRLKIKAKKLKSKI